MSADEGLPQDLKDLVWSVEAGLGEVLGEAEGRPFYDAVEEIRLLMVKVRTQGPSGQRRALSRAASLLRAHPAPWKALLARAYTVYLELVNVCENAYRTHRLRSRFRHRGQTPRARADLVYVFTAHPTESRSPDNIRLLRRTQDLLVESLERGEHPDRDLLKHLLHLVWRCGTHPRHKPSVVDEAHHLLSLLSDPILAELIALRDEGHRVRLRTWVGGDKDGHPGVGPEETSASLNSSRERLLGFVRARLLPALHEDVALLPDASLQGHLASLEASLDGLRHVGIGDGRRVGELTRTLGAFSTAYARRRGHAHPSLTRLRQLLELFGGLVLPLELREERGRFTPGSPIADMMHFVGDVARGGEVGWYVRGCVVSMAGSPEDLWEAERLARSVLGAPLLPIVPLFELPDVLRRATQILEGALADPGFREMVAAEGDRLEVMLGYSDTAKRMGVLPSRVAIHDAMRAVGEWGARHRLNITFFHGSGGSVGRGGGSIEDRAASWPAGACRLLKETLQGEMVERTLATPEILRSQVEKVAAVQAAPPKARQVGALARELSAAAEAAFVDVVAGEDFHALLAAATPYARLGELTIGSRPSSRGGPARRAGLEGLRAIPWVLCWTQTRYLLPTWLGVGTAWRALRRTPGGRARLARELASDPLLRSYLRVLGFSMAKTAPLIWQAYAHALDGRDPALLERLERERRDALDLALEASEGGELLSHRRWLAESIRLRAPMIHPLNLLQIGVLQRRGLSEAQLLLLRETVTGIAAGMLTTG